MNKKLLITLLAVFASCLLPLKSWGADASMVATGTASSVLSNGTNLDAIGDATTGQPIEEQLTTITQRGGNYYKAKVTQIQTITATLEGQTKQKTKYEITVSQTGQKYSVEYWNGTLNFKPRLNDNILISLEQGVDPANPSISIISPDRSNLIIISLFLLFLSCLALSGTKGVKAILLPIIWLAICVLFILPLYLNGWPAWGLFMINILSASAMVYLAIGKWNLIAHVTTGAIAASGIVLWAAIQAYVWLGNFEGLDDPIAKTFFSDHQTIDSRGLLVLSMSILGLAVIIPLAKGITHAIQTMAETEQPISYKKLFISGVRYGTEKISFLFWPTLGVWIASSLPLWLTRFTDQSTNIYFINQIQVAEMFILPIPIIFSGISSIFITSWLAASILAAKEKIIKPLQTDLFTDTPQAD